MNETPAADPHTNLDRLDLRASLPFFGFHLLLGLVFVTGVKWEWVLLAVASYAVRMFAVTAGYHRYFSHRAFKTSRWFQFVLAWLAQTSVQKGVLWWASHHRQHHKHADTQDDVHSPVRHGFWWSHVGWFLSNRHDKTHYDSIKDYARFPELVWLNEHHLVPSLSALMVAWLVGGLPWVVWGAVVPTVLLWHGTFTINSLAHVFGRRRYLTTDTSRNSAILAFITLGEGWHNNHHFFQSSANQGFFWWEFDLTYLGLRVLAVLGVVRELRSPRPEAKHAFRAYTEAQRSQLEAQSRLGNWAPQPEPAPQPRPLAFGHDAQPH